MKININIIEMATKAAGIKKKKYKIVETAKAAKATDAVQLGDVIDEII